MLSAIGAVSARFVAALGVAVALSIGFFALSIPLDLFLRLARLGNIPWLNEVIEYLLYAGIFLAAPWVLRQGAHVRVDLVQTALPAGMARWLERGLDALGLLICLVLAYYGTLAIADAVANNAIERKTLDVPQWYLLSVFVVSMALVAIEFAIRLARQPDAGERAREAGEQAGF